MRVDELASMAWSGLTPELLAKARRRVKTVAWVMLAGMAIGSAFDLTYANLVIGEVRPAWVVGSVLAVLLSAGLVLFVRSDHTSHLQALHAALAYEVVFCFALAVLTPWIVYVESGTVPYVTWVTALIIFFPLVVPSPPRVTLVTAIAAAATRPLGLLVLELSAGADLSAADYVASTFSPAFAVLLAYAGSRVVHGLSVDLSEAQRMGSYELESRLGTGGMGEVWRAHHQLLARPAAVKLIRPETLSSRPSHQRVTIARFEREAQATAALRSPHTIQLYDFGITDGGTFYYVMELLDGLDLDALVSRFGPMPQSRVVHLLLQVCDSLGEAHDAGLIHRDLKPANIYVCRYGRRVDHVKVLDFGLVKFDGADDDRDPGLSGEDRLSGTPAFMAPEQVTGGHVDARTDIYQLGCVAYWLLTGSCVFRADTALSTMVMHVEATPSAPSGAAEQPVSAALDRVVLACLEKDPARRPPSVDRLGELL
ncbi:MAG: serine/threonine-protein kinase, partial [Candidatus Eiseniibacteriota bacterium]